MTKCYILDERGNWAEPVAQAAKRAGYEPIRITRGRQATEPDSVGFIRPHATPEVLRQNWADYDLMAETCQMVQDQRQVLLYENKCRQTQHYFQWLPETAAVEDYDVAAAWASKRGYPLVSKAREGASSANVRILHDEEELTAHLDQAFGPGVPIKYCDGGNGKLSSTGIQKGYVILQEFIPHDVTYRVNIIGNGRAVFERYNYPDKPVAQTGNVEPCLHLSHFTQKLLAFADEIAESIGTKWCALDILHYDGKFYLLETSLAWPWPSPGACMDAPIFRTRYKWSQLFDCMFEECLK